MRIEDRYLPSSESTQTAKAGESSSSGSAARAKQEGVPAHEDTVALSSHISLVEQASTAGEAQRAAETAQLKADYEAGRLALPAGELAGRLASGILGEIE